MLIDLAGLQTLLGFDALGRSPLYECRSQQSPPSPPPPCPIIHGRQHHHSNRFKIAELTDESKQAFRNASYSIEHSYVSTSNGRTRRASNTSLILSHCKALLSRQSCPFLDERVVGPEAKFSLDCFVWCHGMQSLHHPSALPLTCNAQFSMGAEKPAEGEEPDD